MPVTFPKSSGVTATQPPAQATPPAAATTPARAIANPNRGDDGFGAPPPGEGGTGNGKKWDEFTPLPAGNYTFIACVGDISTLTSKTTGQRGTVVEWKVLTGDEAGRPLSWNQAPAPGASEKAVAFWQRQLIGAYTAGGWSWDANPETGWSGWPEICDNTGAPLMDARGNPRKAAPWDTFFVEVCADGITVPVCFEIKVTIDAGYEQYPKVTSVKRILDNAGRPVQAPMPRRVPAWLAEMHRWDGERVTISGNPAVKLDWKQIPLKHAGLSTYKDLQ